MKFNQYIWNLYKNSSEGQKAIRGFEEASSDVSEIDLVFKYNPRMKLWFDDDKSKLSISNICECLWCYNICEFPDEERPKTLEEAKLYMKNNQEIEEAFLQARSYACLLESSVIVLCDKHCLIVYEKKQSFDRDNYKKYYWGELENTDLFNELKNKLNYK